MTYELYIGDRAFSSWSMRGWLMLEKFNLPYRSHLVGLYSGTMAEDLADLAPARLVPALRDINGNVVFETLAMGETLAEQNPDAGLWPADAAARAFARSMASEMHAGFNALRGDCPMQLFHQWVGYTPSDAVKADLCRIETLVGMARRQFGSAGPWLFGQYSLADAFYAPVAARIAGYGLQVDAATQAYVDTTLADTAFRQWRAVGLTKTYAPFPYPQPLEVKAWPGPKPLSAVTVAQGPSENTECPYSGKPVTHFAEVEGRVFGMCNQGCRDKTVIDAQAWPAFTKLMHR